jgi:RNA polymerase sigma factor (sigma-70 family)
VTQSLPATRATLLARLRDPQDADAWRQFVRLYAAVVYGFGRRRGLQDADAADLMQEVLRTVAHTAGRWNYDPGKGSFRAWLFTVTRSKLADLFARARRQPRGGDEVNERPAPPADGVTDWDKEYQQHAFAWAAEQVRGEFQEATWQAFWLTAVDGLGAKEAGQRVGLSPGAVYVAKSRVLSRLREEVQMLQEE